MIASGPRAPRPGAVHTFVTTFDLQSLRDLPELGLAVESADEETRDAQIWGSSLSIGQALTFNQPVMRADFTSKRTTDLRVCAHF